MDPQTGYRHYTTAQIPVAQIIRRFRNLDMPLNDIQAVLAAPDLQTRNDVIASHLSRLEGNLARTQGAVASLRNLLQHPRLLRASNTVASPPQPQPQSHRLSISQTRWPGMKGLWANFTPR